MTVVIDLSTLFEGQAKLADLQTYETCARAIAGHGTDVVLTGAAPIWLYLRLAHALHGEAQRLSYRSPVTGDVVIYDHDPFG